MAQGNLKLQKKAKSTTQKKLQPKDQKKGGKNRRSLFVRGMARKEADDGVDGSVQHELSLRRKT